ncbi:hypothetical protein MTR67_026157 [Solanum verrucosum]|uniref:START domain-containing protein n=1 Tax=Solanum verrucosum TaxID=315347 RepID=A0AAF0QYE5_SOLVR|nr:hypothetical protein MTR67_026157 [Solanum verrucosum]
MLLNLALDSLNELLKLAMSYEPLWIRSLDGGGEILTMKEYDRSFIPIIGIKPSNFTTKATRLKLKYKLFQMWFLSMKYNFYVFVKNMLKVLGLMWMYLSTQSKKVIWIEHMEYDEFFVHHLYLPLIKAGLGFGAQRWMSSLLRQSEFLRVMTSFVCQFHR